MISKYATKYEKPAKHTILSNLIREITQYQICDESHNAKVLQLA